MASLADMLRARGAEGASNEFESFNQASPDVEAGLQPGYRLSNFIQDVKSFPSWFDQSFGSDAPGLEVGKGLLSMLGKMGSVVPPVYSGGLRFTEGTQQSWPFIRALEDLPKSHKEALLRSPIESITKMEDLPGRGGEFNWNVYPRQVKVSTTGTIRPSASALHEYEHNLRDLLRKRGEGVADHYGMHTGNLLTEEQRMFDSPGGQHLVKYLSQSATYKPILSKDQNTLKAQLVQELIAAPADAHTNYPMYGDVVREALKDPEYRAAWLAYSEKNIHPLARELMRSSPQKVIQEEPFKIYRRPKPLEDASLR